MKDNPIKPNTKIRILSPEHSEYVQKLAFEAGFEWLSVSRNIVTDFVGFMFFYDDKCITRSNNIQAFHEKAFEEIQIPLPEIPKETIDALYINHGVPKIDSVILADKVTSAQILEAGLSHMRERAVAYDNESGERSMIATVEAFNAITGHQLTEEQGWHFMTLLKLVRSQQGVKKLDNYEDGAAYFGLAGEAAMRGQQ